VLFDVRRPEDKILERHLNVAAALLNFFDVLIKDINSGLDEKTLPEKLLLAQNFIALNFQRNEISLEDIASSAGISTNHLGLLFREFLQTTPMRYLKAHRLGYAKNLLSRTGLSVGEIAQRVGFVDQLHFSREYHKHFGITPTHTRG
jgi:transcriptional regulator GlxA family with amidase domain